MHSKLGVAIIGTGFGAVAHAPSIVDHSNFELIAFCSAHMERAQAAAAQFGGVDAYDDYRAVIDRTDVEVVIIASPPNLHYPMAMAAINAGKHVICEKQLAMNAAEASEMTAAAEKAGVANAIVFEIRYLPERIRVRELIEEGYVGDVQTVNMTSFCTFPYTTLERAWMIDASLGGGYLGAFGSHCIDMLRCWFGDYSGVYGQRDYHVRSLDDPNQDHQQLLIDAEDGFRAVFKLAAGAGGTLAFHMNVPATETPGPRLLAEIYGSQGTLILPQTGDLRGGRRGEIVQLIDVPGKLGLSGQSIRAVLPRFLDDFAATVAGEARPNMPTFLDGLRCQEFIDGIIQSEQQGRWLDLPARMETHRT